MYTGNRWCLDEDVAHYCFYYAMKHLVLILNFVIGEACVPLEGNEGRNFYCKQIPSRNIKKNVMREILA